MTIENKNERIDVWNWSRCKFNDDSNERRGNKTFKRIIAGTKLNKDELPIYKRKLSINEIKLQTSIVLRDTTGSKSVFINRRFGAF